MASEVSQKKKLEPYTEEQKRRIHELLQSWIECSEDEAKEQQETFEYLKKVLDEDRPGQRKLFP